MIADILLIFFLLSIIVQFGYVLHFFSHIFCPEIKKNARIGHSPVSVIICARNEAGNLKQNLPAVLQQRYTNDAGIPMYEVIVVNDGSDDDTVQVLAALQAQYTHLRTINLPKDMDKPLPGKKTALRQGVAQAANELLLMTDADCAPASEHWLAQMIAPLQQGKLVVAGYGKFRAAGGWLNTFIRWETLHTFLQYSTYARAGLPYMAVGRNIACTKAAFQQAQTYEAWSKLPSGDDDLLVNAVANGKNMEIIAGSDAFTLSDAKNDWDDWVKQKQRHLSTGKYYRPAAIFFVGSFAVAHALCWLTFFLLLVAGDAETATIAMLLRCAVYWMVCYEAIRQTGEKGVAPYMPLLDIGWMMYNFAFSPYVFWKNKRQWK